MSTSRRRFIERIAAAGAFALSSRSLAAFAQRHPLAPLSDALALGARLKRGEITQLDWQDSIASVLQQVTPEELAEAVELERLRLRARHVERGASMLRIPALESLEHAEGAAMRVFFFRAGRSDPPHCHFNSVTAHLVLSGRFRVRHYERVREEPQGFVLQPTRDRRLSPGDVTSISELRENAHWHEAMTDGVLLDVEQGRLDPTIPIRRRQMIDPTAAPSADGLIVAPRLTTQAALQRFG